MPVNRINISKVLEKVGLGKFDELTSEEKVVFYEELLSKVEAMIYINQIEDLNDFTTVRNIYANELAYRLLGFNRSEMDEMGCRLFSETLHSDDINMTSQSIDFHTLKPGDSFVAKIRKVNKKKETFWHLDRWSVLNLKAGKPWQFLIVSMNVQDELQTKKQLSELLRGNTCLQNKLVLCSLTSREKEIIKLITEGMKDTEIARKLFISEKTAKTHRKNILHKLKKKNTAQLVCFAVENGLH
ncbi:MAG: PAS domain-containing protein [Bacteroidales bacterium]|nr:PAS domain-containing protein [Bacteroidales bacterium]